MILKNALRDWPGTTTPLVLAVRDQDATILDAHKPIPQDLSKIDSFYTRWSNLLGQPQLTF